MRKRKKGREIIEGGRGGEKRGRKQTQHHQRPTKKKKRNKKTQAFVINEMGFFDSFLSFFIPPRSSQRSSCAHWRRTVPSLPFLSLPSLFLLALTHEGVFSFIRLFSLLLYLYTCRVPTLLLLIYAKNLQFIHTVDFLNTNAHARTHTHRYTQTHIPHSLLSLTHTDTHTFTLNID